MSDEPVAVVATIDVVDGHLDEVLRGIVAHRARCLSDEPGTLVFEPMLARDEPNRIVLYEAYASQAAFETHWHGPSIAQLRAESGEFWTISTAVWGRPLGG